MRRKGTVYCKGSSEWIVVDADACFVLLQGVNTGRRSLCSVARLLNEYDRAGNVRARRAKKRLEQTLKAKAAAKKEAR